MPKTVIITIPDGEILPEVLSTFTPEKTILAINIGCNCIEDAEKSILGLSKENIYNKIKEESKTQFEKLEMDLLIEKEMTRKVETHVSKIYESQLEQLKKQMEMMRKQIQTYETENKDVINEVIKKEKEKYDFLLESKEKRIEKMQETNEQIKEALLNLTHKSTSHKGSEGEKEFKIYADETFMDFKGYELIDKHTQSGSGDFHMRFEEFDVLVDAKNYKKNVPIDQREKIKKDLIKNEHLTFAWLVSLNTSIDKFDKSPIMYEWINTKQCIVYINNLSQNENPRKILRIVWYTCRELYKLAVEVLTDDVELKELKENQFKFMDKVKNIRKTMREINTSLNSTRNMLQLVDDQLKEILDVETEKLVESNYSIFDEWWEANIEQTSEDVKILSTDMWTKFKQDNKLSIKDFDVTTDKFKQYIKTKVSISKIILKNKNVNSAFEIAGIKWKDSVSEVIPKLEITLVGAEVKAEKKKVKKSKSDVEPYFTEDGLDKRILEEYLEGKDDIMKIADKNNVKTFQVVSLLIRYKIVTKRDEARGYDKYKETDEYKKKLSSE